MGSYQNFTGYAVDAKKTVPNCMTGKRADCNAVSLNSIATVITPSSGKRLRFLGMDLTVSADASILFEDNAAATANLVWRTPLLLAKTPYFIDLANGVLLSAVDNVLKGTASANAAITGTLFYSEE